MNDFDGNFCRNINRHLKIADMDRCQGTSLYVLLAPSPPKKKPTDHGKCCVHQKDLLSDWSRGQKSTNESNRTGIRKATPFRRSHGNVFSPPPPSLSSFPSSKPEVQWALSDITLMQVTLPHLTCVDISDEVHLDDLGNSSHLKIKPFQMLPSFPSAMWGNGDKSSIR